MGPFWNITHSELSRKSNLATSCINPVDMFNTGKGHNPDSITLYVAFRGILRKSSSLILQKPFGLES